MGKKEIQFEVLKAARTAREHNFKIVSIHIPSKHFEGLFVDLLQHLEIAPVCYYGSIPVYFDNDIEDTAIRARGLEDIFEREYKYVRDINCDDDIRAEIGKRSSQNKKRQSQTG